VSARRDIAVKGGKALKRTDGAGGRRGRAFTPPKGTTMPDTLAIFESNSIPSGHAVGPVNGHRANRQSSKAQRPRDAAVRSTGEGCEALELWRQFKHAEETLNARIDEDDDTPEIAYHAAQDRFIDCRVASLDGVLLKLLLINEMEDLDRDLKDAPRWALPRIIKSLLRDLKAQVGSAGIAIEPAPQCAKDGRPAQDSQTAAAASAPTDAIAEAAANRATGGPLAVLESIDARMGEVMMAAYDAKNLASLLEMVSRDGFKEASAKDNYWHKKWWEQAEYISRTLERLGEELQANGEAIETALGDIKYGRAPTSAPTE
jgi:hypothetical protein